MPAEQRETKARQLADEKHPVPLIWRQDLCCVQALHLAAEEHLLLVTLHHIISDGWSMGIFYRELSALYEAFSQGKTSHLPELPYSMRTLRSGRGNGFRSGTEEQIRFWKDHLRALRLRASDSIIRACSTNIQGADIISSCH